MGAIKRFMNGRGMRKFVRSRMAMVSLAVIMLYAGVAVVAAFGAITLDDTLRRVGPNSVPGFFLEEEPERRLEIAEFYISKVANALKRSNIKDALEAVDLAGLKVRSADAADLKKRTEAAFAIVDELGEIDDLNADPKVLPQIVALEKVAMALYAEPQGMSAAGYGFKMFLGTDRQGRSISLRAFYSIRVAAQVGFITAFIAVFIGTLLGAAAAFYGGWVDHAVIWLYSTFSGIPYLVLLTVLVYMFTGTVFDGTLIPLYCAFSMTFWIGPCRVIRGEVLKLKELEYVQAANAVGFSRLYILIKHIVPNTAHLMFIYFSLLFIAAIKSEVILSFLGLGVKKGPSWGIMISQSRQEVINGFFWQIGTATVLMFGLVLAFNILSDALQDAFDPKHVS